MDLSDSSKLLKTFNLNKALESLSCNEDSNAIDSIYTKSTSCETSNQYSFTQSLFGESLLQTIESSHRNFFNLKKEDLGRIEEITKASMSLLEKSEKVLIETTDIKALKVCFFDEDWVEVPINLNCTVKEMLKNCLEVYKKKNYKRNIAVFLSAYDIYNQDVGLIQDLNTAVWTLPSDTFFIKYSANSEVEIKVHHKELSALVRICLEDTLQDLMGKINLEKPFPFFFTRENHVFSSVVFVRGKESACDLNMDLKIKLLLEDELFLNNRDFLDCPGKEKRNSIGEFNIGLINKNSKTSSRVLLVSITGITIKKCEQFEKETLMNKIKMFVNKENKIIEISANELMGVKRISRVNSLEITFRVKKSLKYVLIEAKSPEKAEEIYLEVSSLLGFKVRN